MSRLSISIITPAILGLAMALSGCEGPIGETGPQGEIGPQGEQGEQGESGEDGEDGEDFQAGFVGSASCGACHEEKYEGWKNSGHPYKVVSKDDVVSGTAYPEWVTAMHGETYAVDDDFFSDQASIMAINANTFPSGGWDDVSYVIGGYGWKARFMGTDGYIITGVDDTDYVQYNPPYFPDIYGPNAYDDVDASSALYHTGELMPYTCGTCHTTGWVPDEDAETDGDLSDNQDGLEGIWGTWVEPGIGCEACHGAGLSHVSDPYNVYTPLDPYETCSDCHIRGYEYEIDASGGFIKHHEQYEEMMNSNHAVVGCEGCHDAHNPVRWADEYVSLDGTSSDPNPDYTNRSGVRVECESCHFSEAAAYAEWATDSLASMGGVSCEQCHMPGVAKSAVKAGTYHGDVAGHLFGINVDVDPKEDPDLSTTGTNPANPYISLDFACGGCHSDTAEGSDASNPSLFIWANDALEANGGVHGGL